MEATNSIGDPIPATAKAFADGVAQGRTGVVYCGKENTPVAVIREWTLSELTLPPKCHNCGRDNANGRVYLKTDSYGRWVCSRCLAPKPCVHVPHPPRNKPCPCGSGKKAKRCQH